MDCFCGEVAQSMIWVACFSRLIACAHTADTAVAEHLWFDNNENVIWWWWWWWWRWWRWSRRKQWWSRRRKRRLMTDKLIYWWMMMDAIAFFFGKKKHQRPSANGFVLVPGDGAQHSQGMQPRGHRGASLALWIGQQVRFQGPTTPLKPKGWKLNQPKFPFGK